MYHGCVVRLCWVKGALNLGALPLTSQYYKAYDKLLSKHMSKSEGIGLDLTLVSLAHCTVASTPP